MKPTLPIETERLVLRSFTRIDLEDLYAYQRLPEVARYLYRDPWTRKQAQDQIARYAYYGLEKEGDALTLAVACKETPKVIGEVMIRLTSETACQAEVGYIFNPSFGGRGYATEATRAMLEVGFEVFGFHRIFARVDVENVASVSICKRLGMRREAHLIENDFFGDRWGSEYVFAILCREWDETG